MVTVIICWGVPATPTYELDSEDVVVAVVVHGTCSITFLYVYIQLFRHDKIQNKSYMNQYLYLRSCVNNMLLISGDGNSDWRCVEMETWMAKATGASDPAGPASHDSSRRLFHFLLCRQWMKTIAVVKYSLHNKSRTHTESSSFTTASEIMNAYCSDKGHQMHIFPPVTFQTQTQNNNNNYYCY